MKVRILVGLLFACGLHAFAAATGDYPQLKSEAEKLFGDHSYARAHAVYEQAKALYLSTADGRWVDFRLADTLWRSEAATQGPDTTKIEAAQHQLEGLNRDRTRAEDHDRVWAEVEESLGDFYWTRRNSPNWGGAWPHYQNALDWWAGLPDIELARERYLKIIWTCARPDWVDARYYYYGYYGNMLPVEVLDNALKIAQSANDQAHAHYLVAMTLRQQGGDWTHLRRVPAEFEAAIKSGKRTDWYDDALFNYGQWMEGNGRVIPLQGGTWTQRPDYVRAVEIYRQLMRDYSEGESRYWPQARDHIKQITDAVVGVSVANVFLPDSEIQYSLNWRNVKHVDLALYAVDLTRDVHLPASGSEQSEWLQAIDLSGRERIKSWAFETGDKGIYEPGGTNLHYEGKLAAGAYVIEAKGEGKAARDLLLVSDASVVTKLSANQALIFVCNALNGSPVAGADLHLWEGWYTPADRQWHWRDAEKKSGEDGTALFDLQVENNQRRLFVGARLKDRQSFSSATPWFSTDPRQNWKIYATTDRPAYRPKETVQWKFTVRKYDGTSYSTPSEQRIEYEIQDPRGAKVQSSNVVLNAFGSTFGTLELTEAMPLGEYRVTFFDANKAHNIGSATLFRLEEYKLPEFKVTVEMPEENGHKKSFRLGESVTVNVQADYYFGGGVGNADVEVVVYQNPYYHYWTPAHDYPWYYTDMAPDYRMRYWGGQGPIIKRETLKTDAMGRAKLTFDTPANAGQDFEYRVEARVTDASRREITGSGTARVTRQRYFVNAQPGHNLFRPQDKVTVEFKAQDANSSPVQTEGTVKVTRDYWYEIWLDPGGREVKGDELKRLQADSRIFPPPPPRPNDPAWKLKFRGYQHDDILTRTLKTDTNGEAQLVFTPERDGYYRVAWTSEDNANTNLLPAAPITADTMVWVATTASTELGYRSGGVEIVVDKDTFRSGQTAPVMLSVPTSDRYVLFTVEGRNLISYQVVHVTGTVKLIEMPIEEKHVPNIFLGAAMASDRQIYTDSKQVIVPPTKNFLTVEVKPDREQYQPQESGTFTVSTFDDQHRPVSAEVSFGLADEAVYYIQQDYAGDSREFFFGQKRPNEIQMQSTFNLKSFVKLVLGEKDQLIDERDRDKRQADQSDSEESGGDRDGNGLLRQRSRAYAAKEIEEGGFGGGGGRGGGRFAVSDSMESLGRRKDETFNAPMAIPVRTLSSLGTIGGEIEGTASGGEPTVQVRSDFRSTIIWQPDLMTDKSGQATVRIKYPDSLTSWKATARAATAGNQFGICITNTRTKQPLIVRLEAPRFFLVGDKVTISAVVNNNTDGELKVGCTLNAVGASNLTVTGASNKKGVYGTFVTVPANGEARVDWPVTVTQPGDAKLAVYASAGQLADAMEKTFPTFEHGLEKFLAKSGKTRGDEVTVKLDLPRERKPGSTSLSVQVTPSMAVTMLDALPYLIDYPYGCTEQTMSRFLPAAITAKTLKDLGLAPEDVMYRTFGGIESNSAAATHPNGKRDLQKLQDIEEQSLTRLYDFQHGDGGWGWWKPGDSDHWMTAYVVWGLTLAKDAGVKVREDVLSRGRDYLEKRLVEEEVNYDNQAWMLHALATVKAANNAIKDRNPGPLPLTEFEGKAFTNLSNNREKLNAYTRALLALSAHYFEKTNEAKTLIANLENGVKLDNTPDTSIVMQAPQQSSGSVIGTAHWGDDGIFWRWSEGGVEATAFALRALMVVDPTNQLVEPVCNWLIKNRRGAQWNNTRDTAITVLAMNDYLRASGELTPDLDYEVFVNNRSIARKKVTGAEVFNAPSQFTVDPSLIRDGENDVRIVRHSGKGSLYFAANAKFFSLEEPITAAGSEIFVRRQYFKLVGRPTLLKGFVYERQPLNDGDTVKSGERVETLVTIEAKNNYEYLLFEDLKPAGFEAVEIRSGQPLNATELKSGAAEKKLAAPEAQPASQQRVIRAGDTLSGIARETGVTVGALRQANNLTSDLIRVGQKLVIPRGPRPAPVPNGDYTGRTRGVYQELRDRKVALFIDKLPQGIWEIHYDYRAEVPGQFHALPVTGQAMYVPEIRCNGQEIRLTITDTQP